MTKLLLHLVVKTDNPFMATIRREFPAFVVDRRSHRALDKAVRAGVFGNHSKSSYFLRGVIQDGNGSEEIIDFPMYRKTTGSPPRQVLDVPAVLEDVLG